MVLKSEPRVGERADSFEKVGSVSQNQAGDGHLTSSRKRCSRE